LPTRELHTRLGPQYQADIPAVLAWEDEEPKDAAGTNLWDPSIISPAEGFFVKFCDIFPTREISPRFQKPKKLVHPRRNS